MRCDLVRPRVDGEQYVTLADNRTVYEMDLVDIAGDARPNLHALQRFEAAGIFIPQCDPSRDRVGNGHLRRLLCRCGAGECRERTAAEKHAKDRLAKSHLHRSPRPDFRCGHPVTGMRPRYATLADKWQNRHLTINMRSYSWPYGPLRAQRARFACGNGPGSEPTVAVALIHFPMQAPRSRSCRRSQGPSDGEANRRGAVVPEPPKLLGKTITNP
jgi:hypothetical protein